MTIADVTTAYHPQSKLVHPDKHPSPGPAERFQTLETVKDHLITRWDNKSWGAPFLNLHLKGAGYGGGSELQQRANERSQGCGHHPNAEYCGYGCFHWCNKLCTKHCSHVHEQPRSQRVQGTDWSRMLRPGLFEHSNAGR